MQTDFSPQPHDEAIALIKDKPIVTREVFDAMLPEIRGRVFTITGVEGANVMQRVRDSIAALPEGQTWDESKQQIVDELSPYLGEGADRRAELLLRTHGFQAFQASNWRVAQEDEDTTHLQYLATEDDRVRDSHLALNGLILPKNDPFWQKHFPPWEWGCRCRTRPINPDLLDEAKQEDEKRLPENKLVMEGPAAEQLRNGTLIRDGRRYDVTAPSDRPDENGTAYQWHPDNLRIPVNDLKQRYDADVWQTFEESAKGNNIEQGVSVWDWLQGQKLSPIEKRMADAPPSLPPMGRPDPNAPESGQAFTEALREQKALEERRSKQIADAQTEFQPSELSEKDIERELQRIEQERQNNTVPEDISGEKLPEVPPELRDKVNETLLKNANYQRELDRIFAKSDLYYQQNPHALDSIRAWRARQIAALNVKYGKSSA